MAQVNEIAPPSKYEILRQVVKDYPGILSTIKPLMNALHSDTKNWNLIVNEIRAYALKNFTIHDLHAKGTEAIRVVIETLLEAVNTTDSSTVQQNAIDSILFYLEKILLDSDQDFNKYSMVFQDCFESLNQLQEEQFFFLITNPHQLNKLGQAILKKLPVTIDLGILNGLIFKSLATTYTYWLKEEDPLEWFKTLSNQTLHIKNTSEFEKSFYFVSHTHLRELNVNLNNLTITDEPVLLEELLKFPSYMNFVKYYFELAESLPQTGVIEKDQHLKVSYLLKIVQTQGLFSIHEDALRELNRTLSAAIGLENINQIKAIVSHTFNTIKPILATYPDLTLYCVQSIGNEIYKKGDGSLVEWYIKNIISLGFQYPGIKGVTDEWQVTSNRGHLKNIRIWLELIGNNPKWSESLISALIIHLSLGGVYISDTDLFQKDITKLLNSNIETVFHLIKQLTRLFPVYFCEIGAEGKLRETSTGIDEITGRKDPLIHFIRKQNHVESSARVIDFLEEIIYFWKTKDKNPLKSFLPKEIFDLIESSGPYVDELHTVFTCIFKKKTLQNVTGLLRLGENDIDAILDDIQEVSEKEKTRARLAIQFYKLLNQKYRLNVYDIKTQLKQAPSLGLPSTDTLMRVLENGNVYKQLEELLKYLQRLKEIIFSPEKFQPVENIFRRRHIAAGIQSIYGNYHERKFDALALTFRLEHFANTLFEELVDSFSTKFITRTTLFDINKCISLFYNALQLDGITSNRLANTLNLLTGALGVRRFSFSQYIDIFKGFSEAIQDILRTYYSGIHKNNLKYIILHIGFENMLPKYLGDYHTYSDNEILNKVSEQFLREIVASSFGLQQLDNLTSNFLKTLLEQGKELDEDKLSLLMSYDPQKIVCPIRNPHRSLYNKIYLGNKGYNLLRMSSLGLPVPPGFIITTEVFRCIKAINKFYYVKKHLDEKIKEQIANLEHITHKQFGFPENPLLVSVRSSSAISMPGMMTSFLNVGINESIVKGLIRQTGKPWYAWDCYRRFLQFWGMSFGMERGYFDNIINASKKRYKTSRKIQFTPEQMKETAIAYRKAIQDFGIEIINDPEEQLNTVISQVFSSWFSQKARAYRNIMGISEQWGTAIVVQAMVYGNLDSNAGSGVIFTRNPHEAADRIMLWGDFAFANQGDDIVSGLVNTHPVSKEQSAIEGREADISLQDIFPEIYNELLNHVYDLIYKEGWGAQDIEFTFEGKKKQNLYMLQSRDMTITQQESLDAFIPSLELSRHYLSNGIGVGGGALSGRVVFSMDEIDKFREKDPATPLILVRADTVPDDITQISSVEGLLTARGGSTSHAAIIASRLGKTCVVGCIDLVVHENDRRCKLRNLNIKSGEFISIDGRSGSVYYGKHPTQEISIL